MDCMTRKENNQDFLNLSGSLKMRWHSYRSMGIILCSCSIIGLLISYSLSHCAFEADFQQGLGFFVGGRRGGDDAAAVSAGKSSVDAGAPW